MFDTSIKPVRRGDSVRADWHNDIVEALLACLVVGPGLTLTRQGGKIIIALAQNNPQIIPK
jgi:hypothetical protein